MLFSVLHTAPSILWIFQKNVLSLFVFENHAIGARAFLNTIKTMYSGKLREYLNDLYRTRLFRRTIWLLPPSPPRSVSRPATHRNTEAEIHLADGIGWQGMGEET